MIEHTSPFDRCGRCGKTRIEHADPIVGHPFSYDASLEATRVALLSDLTKHLILRYAIRFSPFDEDDRPRYRCRECQLSWLGQRTEHPADPECAVWVVLNTCQR